MSKKSEKRHEEALRQIQASVLDRDWLYDKEVLAAVKLVVAKTTASHTIQSRQNSLLSLMKTDFDSVLFAWSVRNSCTQSWKFSDLAVMPHGVAHDCIKKLGRLWNYDESPLAEDFGRMADLLIYFLSFCAAHHSETTEKIYLNPKRRQSNSELSERIGKGLKAGSRSDGKQLDVPGYLTGIRDLLQGAGLCQACGDPTAAQCELESVTDQQSKVDSTLKGKIAAGVEFASKTKGSHYFCPAHSERDGGNAAYKRARRQIGPFLSLILAMRFSGIHGALLELFPFEFHIPLAKLAIRAPNCVLAIPLIVTDDSGIVTGHSGDRDRRYETVRHSAL